MGLLVPYFFVYLVRVFSLKILSVYGFAHTAAVYIFPRFELEEHTVVLNYDSLTVHIRLYIQTLVYIP